MVSVSFTRAGASANVHAGKGSSAGRSAFMSPRRCWVHTLYTIWASVSETNSIFCSSTLETQSGHTSLYPLIILHSFGTSNCGAPGGDSQQPSAASGVRIASSRKPVATFTISSLCSGVTSFGGAGIGSPSSPSYSIFMPTGGAKSIVVLSLPSPSSPVHCPDTSLQVALSMVIRPASKGSTISFAFARSGASASVQAGKGPSASRSAFMQPIRCCV
mmetsp:Transcript_1443/g.3372  ORF Transcript_1443/g.3372 Transcript_1443/m.3372 type:complete len:217 (-) Transcript_1443:538-1188(-)